MKMAGKTDLVEALALRDEALKYKAENKLLFFDPYPYQKEFSDSGKGAGQRLLQAANRIGKSEIGAFETACHATGIYPAWWGGRRFTGPVKIWAAGINNDKTRDILQSKLLGDAGNPSDVGRGMIPKSCLGEPIRKPGVPNALQGIYVKHVSGGLSYLGFKSYEMEAVGFMGESVDVIWLDEEPKQDIYSQALTRTLDKMGIVYMTFTPENGVTEIVGQYMDSLKPGQSLTTAGWKDASEDIRTVKNGKPGHLNKEKMEQLLAAYHPSERQMRSEGVPMYGTGLVYPVDDSNIICDPFEIPDHYLRNMGLDFGWDHATAMVSVALNADTDVVYVYDAYKEAKLTPMVHASALKKRGADWIPVMWPHDGNRADGYGGPTLAEIYRKEGVNMHYEQFSNPPSIGEREGGGGNSVNVGILSILQRMETGRLKVFSNLKEWFDEKRRYHRKDGKIVRMNNDLMSATRYAVMSLRHSVSKTYMSQAKGKINYPRMGIV